MAGRPGRGGREPSLVSSGTKRCTSCGVEKPWDADNKFASGFYVDKRVLKKSGETAFYPKGECKECSHARVARWRDAEREAGRMAERQRGYQRNRDHVADAARRRESRAFDADMRGRAVRTKSIQDRGQNRKDNRPFVEWLREYEALTGVTHQAIGHALKSRFGMKDGERRLRAIEDGQSKVTIDFVDKVAIAMDQPFLLALLYPDD